VDIGNVHQLRRLTIGQPKMSYLDDPRVFFAAERTLHAWQRTALALMGFGFVVERFGLFLRMVAGISSPESQRAFSLWIGVALLLLGAVVAIVSATQFKVFAGALRAPEIPHGYRTNFGVCTNLLLAAVAMLVAIHFVWTAG
jgi:putative membrane protein